jgi:hypothetical protein
MVLLGLRSTIDGADLSPTVMFRVLVPQALLNGILVPVLYPIAGWLGSRVEARS